MTPLDEPPMLQALSRLIDTVQPVYLLVDPLAGDPAPIADAVDPQALRATELRAQREAAWQRLVYPIELHASIDLAPALHPYLVALAPRNDVWVTESAAMALDEHRQCRRAQGEGAGLSVHRIGGWLQTGHAPEKLAALMAQLMKLNTAVTTKARYLRLADRRVLALTRVAKGDEALREALGFVEQWIYLDPVGQWATLTGSNDEPKPKSLRFESPQWAMLSLGHRVQPALAQWLAQCDRLDLPQPTAHQALNLACAAVRAAQASGQRWPRRFANEADHIAWAALHMQHPQLHERADVAALMHDPADSAEPPETLQTLRSTLEHLAQQSSDT